MPTVDVLMVLDLDANGDLKCSCIKQRKVFREADVLRAVDLYTIAREVLDGEEPEGELARIFKELMSAARRGETQVRFPEEPSARARQRLEGLGYKVVPCNKGVYILFGKSDEKI